jgi:2-polyprenyl-6-methoxyphenol hydroxylase-like FAD-dependent oxidoreductase
LHVTISSDYDVVVIGGGPAGSTVSTLLAQQGVRVGLFERERFPRFHIGESLIPETYWVLKRLNMLPKMQRSHFVKKYSVQFVNSIGKLSAPFYFWDNKPHECSQTWQVVRSEFDKMLLDNAREHGVDAHEGVHVVDVLYEDSRSPDAKAVGVRIQPAGEPRREIRAKVVVDASGQAALMQNRRGLRVWDPLLNKGAIWTYWRGAYRDTGKDEGATMVLQTADRHGWFWYIPLHDDIVSVGVVAPAKELLKGRGTPEQIYTDGREVRRGEGLYRRLRACHRLFRHQGLLVSRVEAGRRRLGADRRRLRLPRSAVLIWCPARAQVWRNGRRRNRRRPGERRPVRCTSRTLASDLRRGRQPDAAPRLRLLRRLQFRPVRPRIPGSRAPSPIC